MSSTLIHDLKSGLDAEVDALLAATGIQQAVDRTLELLQFSKEPVPALDCTHHGRERMVQRSVSQAEVQRALQYGTKRPGHGGRIIHEDIHSGVRVVTDARSERIVTVISE